MDVMTNKNNIGILVFLVILGTMVQLMNRTGGSAAFGMWASKRIKSRVGAQLSTMLLDPTKTTNYANYLCASCAAVFNS